MRSLIIIAHGSRRQASNDEVRLLAEQVRQLPGLAYDHVDVAFLELAEPSIPDSLASCAARGATEIVAFPYFLAAGTHVANDIPEIIEGFRQAHPDVQVRLTAHLGASALLPQVLLAVADSR
ncbi:MAG: CbiX/SirB N-terminal domain-containing protein [Hydrogenophilaceae bacterium]|nr:CbiX/SirB N-terminal domain-containing protein [Hydrogenophilaceae bacterium]